MSANSIISTDCELIGAWEIYMTLFEYNGRFSYYCVFQSYTSLFDILYLSLSTLSLRNKQAIFSTCVYVYIYMYVVGRGQKSKLPWNYMYT